MIDLYKKRSLGTFCSEVLLLVISAFIYSIAFPGFVSEKVLGFIAFFAIIPVLIVIKNTSWKAVGFHGFLFGVAFYCFGGAVCGALPSLYDLVSLPLRGGQAVGIRPRNGGV